MSRWMQEASPVDKGAGSGWFAEMDRCYRQERKYVVMTRKVITEWGTVTHACIRNRDNADIPWSEKQRIKNELFGRNATAIEVFPSEDKLVDKANMYHLWILPEGFELPFGLHK